MICEARKKRTLSSSRISAEVERHGVVSKKKNLWRRKCVRREIFRNIEVRVEGRFVPFNPYFVCNTAIGSLCDLYGVPLPKKLT